MPLVSVVIPTCRRPRLVRRAVESVLHQTMKDLELIVVIDGPDDETRNALLLVADERLRVLQNARSLGGGRSRNIGAAEALSPWVAFLDDDDEWLPHKLERQLECAGPPGEAIVVTCLSHVVTPIARYVWPRTPYDNKMPLDEYLFDRRSFFQGDSFLQTSSLLMPIELFNAFKFGSQGRHEDWDICLRLTKLGGARIKTVAEPLVVYYTEDSRASVGARVPWRLSVAWADASRALIGARAYSGFCLTVLAPHTRNAREFLALLWIALRGGRPTGMQLLAYVAFALTSSSTRRKLRSILAGRPSRPVD